MNWNIWMRQGHRWISIIFVLIVAGLFAMQGARMAVAEWAYFLPLAPLALMMISGLYLFILPYALRARGRSDTAGKVQAP